MSKYRCKWISVILAKKILVGWGKNLKDTVLIDVTR